MSLVEHVLCDKYYTDISVKTAFGKAITHVPRVGLIQEIVQQDQSWAITCLLEIRDAPVIDYTSSVREEWQSSLNHHTISHKSDTVHSLFILAIKRTQNDVLPQPLGLEIIQVNGFMTCTEKRGLSTRRLYTRR
jgi:hypothetical protein